MPFKDPLRMLILPPGISIPPPVGESALQLDPGPPPQIVFYTGSADEFDPANLRTAIAAGDLFLIINGPLTDNVNAAGVEQAFISLFSDNVITNVGIRLSATQVLIGGHAGVASESQIISLDSPFEYTSGGGTGKMDAQTSFDTSNNAGQTNTAFGTAPGPTGVGFSFVAPPSGRGIVTCHALLGVNTTAAVSRTARAAPRLGTGGTIGGGTAQNILGIASPHNDFSVDAYRDLSDGAGSHFVQACVSTLITGLTAGNTYNWEVQTAIGSATSASYDRNGVSITWLPLY